jgi:hypothetical protein
MFQSKIIKIDSSKATSYKNAYHTSFSFVLDPPISVMPANSIVFSLVSAFIPYSFYSINPNNQYLDVRETISGVSTLRTIVIPSGNYSAYDLAKTLTSMLNNKPTMTYTIIYNRTSNTYDISTSGTTSATFLFGSGTHRNTSCHKFLGIPADDVLINHIPVSTGLITMNDCYYLQIKSDLGESSNILTGDGNDSILEVIPVSDQPLNFISFYPFNPNKFLLHNTTLNLINISLLDNYNRELDLNGIPYQLTIKIDIIENESNNIAMGQGRGKELPSQTNLEYILKNPGSIDPPVPRNGLNVSDFVEYQLIQNMLRKLAKKSKNKHSKKI